MVNPRAWVAEAISTYALVFFGPIAIALTFVTFGEELTTQSLIYISLAHGGTIALMVYAFGHVSGAHINPAVTIPMILTKRIGLADGIGYIGSQLAGAIIAALSLMAIIPDLASQVNYGTQGGPSDLLQNSMASGFAVEAILTFFLVTAVFMTAIHKKASPGWHGFTIGGMVFITHIVGIPLTGASINPARTFGPALVSGFWDYHIMYWAGPIVGGIIAGLAMSYVFMSRADRQATD